MYNAVLYLNPYLLGYTTPSALVAPGKLSGPYCGQLKQLGVQSEHPGHHDLRVRKVDAKKDKPTKIQKYKYESREEALATKKEKASRARRERHRCATEHLMAAQKKEEEKIHTRKRGGQKVWKNSVC